MRAWHCLLLLWLGIGSACGSLSPVPGDGGATWHRFETPHFVLYTDQREQRARSTIAHFERILDAYYQLGWEAHGELPVKVEVVILDDRSDFYVFSQREVDGFTVQRRLFEPLIVAPSARPWEGYQTVNHELTHFIAGQSLQFQPPWLQEGLAVYFETAYINRRQEFVVGVANQRLSLAQRGVRIPAREVLAATETTVTPRFYASAWLIVHYLMSKRGDEFVRLQDRLEEGLPLTAAWAAALPDLPLDQLDDVLDDYLEHQRLRYFTRALTPFKAPAIASTTLSTADVYALRARLFQGCWHCSGRDQESAIDDNVAHALQLEPRNLLASVIHVQRLPEGQRLAPAEALVREHPEAWRAWFLLADAQLHEPNGRCTPEVSDQLRTLGAQAAYAVMASAECEAAAGNSAEALALSARALRIGPTETPLLVDRARLLWKVAACDDLQKLLPRVRAATHFTADPQSLARWSQCGQHALHQ